MRLTEVSVAMGECHGVVIVVGAVLECSCSFPTPHGQQLPQYNLIVIKLIG